MTIEQLTQWMERSETLGKEQLPELRTLCEEFPYFIISKILMLKTLQNTNDVLFETEINKIAIYCYDRRKLYFLLYPQKAAIESNALSKESFDIRQSETGSDKSLSLKSLAKKLKENRLQNSPQEVSGSVISSSDQASGDSLVAGEKNALQEKEQPMAAAMLDSLVKTIETPQASELQTLSDVTLLYTEEEAIRLIKSKEYGKALEILRVLHLNIPEKSVYFADQIRFIEKIIATIKKS
jgi:hypothetical protein